MCQNFQKKTDAPRQARHCTESKKDTMDHNTPITEDDIANYLVNTPDFFERHAEVLAAVQLTSPHSHRTISLQERQAEMMRAKIRELELAQSHMVRYGQNNVAIADKMNVWIEQLLAAQSSDAMLETISPGLAQTYDIAQSVLKVWGVPGVSESVAVPADGALAQGVQTQATIRCGALDDSDALRQALPDPAAAASAAVIPLQRSADEAPLGVLILASDDAERFTPDMGTLFLERVGLLSTAALRRLMPSTE
ncbi:MAG: hypothetical protein RL357_146 [Pseudomonadota bacterium]|jgi:uncharacterized protein YigA (DUF484 family)